MLSCRQLSAKVNLRCEISRFDVIVRVGGSAGADARAEALDAEMVQLKIGMAEAAARYKDEVDVAEGRAEALGGEVASLKEALEEAAVKADARVVTLNAEMAQIKKARNETEEAAARLKDEVNVANARAEALGGEVVLLKAAVEEAAGERAALLVRAEELEQARAQLAEERDALHAKAARAEEALAVESVEADRVRALLEQADARVVALDAELVQIKEAAKDEVDAANARAGALGEEVALLKTGMEALELKREGARAAVADARVLELGEEVASPPPPLCLPLSLSHTHTLSLSHTHTLSLSLTHSLSLSLLRR